MCSYKPPEKKLDSFAIKTDTAESEVEPEKVDLSWREKQDLKLRKNRAYTTIYQSLNLEFQPLISGTKHRDKVWKILHDHFESTTRARVI